MATTGEKIKYYRKKQKISRETLSNQLKISIHTLSKYEQEQRKPTTKMLIAIANALNVTVLDLMNDEHISFKKVTEELNSAIEGTKPFLEAIDGLKAIMNYAELGTILDELTDDDVDEYKRLLNEIALYLQFELFKKKSKKTDRYPTHNILSRNT